MELNITELQEKYACKFTISEGKGWLRIRSLKPMFKNHPAANGPAYLDYNIEKNDDRPNASLEDRSRNVWLRDSRGEGVISVSYCGGMGIW